MARVRKGGGREKIIDGVVYDARVEVERILDRARVEAVEIVAGADRVREEARQGGLVEGREAGLAEVSALLASAQVAAARRLVAAEPELRALAVRIAEKILGREIELSPDAVVDVVAQSLAAARCRGRIEVRVHPDDLSRVTAAGPRLAAAIAGGAQLAVRADPAVGRGGCVVETEVGAIDSRLDVQLRAIERALCGEGGE